MNLTPAIEEALDRFALEQNITREEALAVIARDWLTGAGYFKPAPGDEDPEVSNTASIGHVVGNG